MATGKKVKYRVLKRCFVNGSLLDPGKGVDVIVEADEGLAGPALEPVEDAPKPAAPPPAERPVLATKSGTR